MQQQQQQQNAKAGYIARQLQEKLENQSRQRFFRMPINGIPFHRVVEELLTRTIEWKSDADTEVISRLLQLEQKSRKEIVALQNAFRNLKFFHEAEEFLSKKDFEGLLQEIKYEKFKRFQHVFQFDEMGYKYYIILKGAVFVQIPNKNYSKYDTNSPKVIYPDIKPNHVHSPVTKDHHQSIIKDKSPIEQQQQLRNASELSPSNSSSSSSSSRSDSESPNKQQGQDSPQGQKTPLENNNNLKKTRILALNLAQKIRRQSNFREEKSSKHKTPQTPSHSRFHEAVEDLNDVKEKIITLFPQFDIVRELCAGDAFGEIALVNNARRTASIICKEETTFAVLSKQSYDKILSQYHQTIQQKNISFLQQFALFSQLGRSKLDALFRLMEPQELKKNQVIYSQGEPAKYVYFIREGEVQIFQEFKNLQDGRDKKQNSEPGDYELNEMMEIFNLKYKGQIAKEGSKRIKIAILGNTSYFGHEEILFNTHRLYRAEVYSTQATLYAIQKQKFLGMLKMMPDAMEIMQRELQERSNWRISQFEKNRTTSKVIENEITKMQNDLEKYEYAEQAMRQRPHAITQLIGKDRGLNVSMMDDQGKDEVEQGNHSGYDKNDQCDPTYIIRQKQDTDKINEAVLNCIVQKKPIKNKKQQESLSSDDRKHNQGTKSKLFKMSLTNSLFQEETDKITKRVQKQILSPRQFNNYIVSHHHNNQVSSQQSPSSQANNNHTNMQGQPLHNENDFHQLLDSFLTSARNINIIQQQSQKKLKEVQDMAQSALEYNSQGEIQYNEDDYGNVMLTMANKKISIDQQLLHHSFSTNSINISCLKSHHFNNDKNQLLNNGQSTLFAQKTITEMSSSNSNSKSACYYPQSSNSIFLNQQRLEGGKQGNNNNNNNTCMQQISPEASNNVKLGYQQQQQSQQHPYGLNCKIQKRTQSASSHQSKSSNAIGSLGKQQQQQQQHQPQLRILVPNTPTDTPKTQQPHHSQEQSSMVTSLGSPSSIYNTPNTQNYSNNGKQLKKQFFHLQRTLSLGTDHLQKQQHFHGSLNTNHQNHRQYTVNYANQQNSTPKNDHSKSKDVIVVAEEEDKQEERKQQNNESTQVEIDSKHESNNNDDDNNNNNQEQQQPQQLIRVVCCGPTTNSLSIQPGSQKSFQQQLKVQLSLSQVQQSSAKKKLLRENTTNIISSNNNNSSNNTNNLLTTSKNRPWSSCLTSQQLKLRNNKEDDQTIISHQQKKSLTISEKYIPSVVPVASQAQTQQDQPLENKDETKELHTEEKKEQEQQQKPKQFLLSPRLTSPSTQPYLPITSPQPSSNPPGDYHNNINPFNNGTAESDDRSPKYNECLPNNTNTNNNNNNNDKTTKISSHNPQSKPNNRFSSEFYSTPLRAQSLSSILLTTGKHTHSISLTKQQTQQQTDSSSNLFHNSISSHIPIDLSSSPIATSKNNPMGLLFSPSATPNSFITKRPQSSSIVTSCAHKDKHLTNGIDWNTFMNPGQSYQSKQIQNHTSSMLYTPKTEESVNRKEAATFTSNPQHYNHNNHKSQKIINILGNAVPSPVFESHTTGVISTPLSSIAMQQYSSTMRVHNGSKTNISSERTQSKNIHMDKLRNAKKEIQPIMNPFKINKQLTKWMATFQATSSTQTVKK